MSPVRLFTLTSLAMLAFAANSILCRVALRETSIDPATFTSIRLISGALVLALIVSSRGKSAVRGGSWISAAALFAYAATFSFAYTQLSAGTGALLLFGAVQATMILWGWHRGERMAWFQGAGLALALGGLVILVLPRIDAPPIAAAALMLCAGLAWGVYSLRGRGASDPLTATAGNFLRAAPIALVASAAFHARFSIDTRGMLCALTSGALTSGIGYTIWYAALRSLDATRAAIVQLCVPALTAVTGVFLLHERFSWYQSLASVAVLGGVGIAVLGPHIKRISGARIGS